MDGAFTAIVGPNACGKSTLLKAFVRLLTPTAGTVTFDGRDVSAYKPKALAREVGFLPQGLVAPEGIAVRRLVARGRYPHQSPLSTWSAADERAVTEAMAAAGVSDLAGRPVEELSGGQRQRVWVAMVLAQETRYLLLDEPTTFLDITHQYELLRPVRPAAGRGAYGHRGAARHQPGLPLRRPLGGHARRPHRRRREHRPTSWTRRSCARSSTCRASSSQTRRPAPRWWSRLPDRQVPFWTISRA